MRSLKPALLLRAAPLLIVLLAQFCAAPDHRVAAPEASTTVSASTTALAEQPPLGPDAGATAGQQSALAAAAFTRQDCITAECHANYDKGASVHAPVKTGDCIKCHLPTDEKHKFEKIPPAEIGALCEQCHEPRTPKHEHFPYRTGLCTVCHEPHHSEFPTLFTKKNDGSLCFQCHDRAHVLHSKKLHGPAAMGGCTLCHNPHGTDEKQFLRDTPTGLCNGCHDTIANLVKERPTKHPPVGQACANCHSPHGTDNEFNLLKPAPELCFTCHEDIRKLAQESALPHRAIAEPRSCLNCHDPHGSHKPKLLHAEPIDLCLKCHDKPLNNLIGIGEHLRKYHNHHGPIRAGACNACHNPHGSENFRLLLRPYPPSFYTKSFALDEFALCLECHEKERFLDKQTTQFTNFRQGERNLHYVHVNRERKGRTCRACHDVHASNLPARIRDVVPFGQWLLPIEYVPLPTGGKCSPGCHVPREYDRTGPADKKY